MHTIFILLLPGIVLAYQILCPDRSHRQLRSHTLCTRRDDAKSVYTCLEDVHRPRLTFIESCSEEEDVVRRGKRYVIRGQSTIGDCSTDRYQPIPFNKTSGPFCMYVTSTCTDVGQLIAMKGSGRSDTTCICDDTEGYAYVTRPKDFCSCVPSVEDCTCYKKPCPENHLLSADNECTQRNTTSMTKCSRSDNPIKFVNTVSTDSIELIGAKTEARYITVRFCFTVLIGIVCIFLLLVCKYTLNRDMDYFGEELDNVEVVEGEDGDFKCKALYDNQKAQWFKDDNELKKTDKYKVKIDVKTHRLVVKKADLDDKGEYSVRTKNCVHRAELTVKEYFTKTLTSQNCTEGENVQFECEVLDDKQAAKWFKDGNDLSTSDRHKVERHGRLHRLVVNNTTLADKGEYSVRIKNCTRLCKLTVKEYFTKALDSQTCTEGENVQFEYEVLDDEQAAEWFKDDTELTSERYKVERNGKLHRLVVYNTTLADKGVYSVRIKNCKRVCKLIVQEIKKANGDYGVQIFRLLQVACFAVRSKFYKIIPPETLAKFIHDNRDKLEQLRNDKEITTEQWKFLYPESGNLDSSKFSLTLMIVILLNTEISKMENQALKALKSYQYTLTENPTVTLDDNDFDDYFRDICASILFLGGNSYKKECASVAPAKQAVLDQILQEIE